MSLDSSYDGRGFALTSFDTRTLRPTTGLSDHSYCRYVAGVAYYHQTSYMYYNSFTLHFTFSSPSPSLSGNTLSRTLLGGRSERNEYLLLHAFTQQGYLPPDKLDSASKNHHGNDEEEESAPAGKRGKSSYVGGLVLDPKTGFYDR